MAYPRMVAAVDRRPSPFFTHLRRSAPGGRGEIICGRLRAASVLVTGEGQVSDLIAALLTRSGVGTVVQRAGRDGSCGRAADRLSPDLTIEVLRGDEDQGQVATGVPASPLLPVWLSYPETTVGPLLDVPGGRCRRCCVAAGQADGGGAAYPDGPAASVAAGVAAGAALRYLGRYGATWAWNAAIGIRMDNGGQQRWPVPRRPGCADCGGSGVRLRGSALAEFDRDQAAELPPCGGDAEPLSPGTRPAAGPARRHLTGLRLNPRMPHAGLLAGGEPGGAAWQTLSWVLERTVGAPRSAHSPAVHVVDHWAPSVANLRPLQAYVVHNLPGEAAQAWFYDGAAHDFVALPQTSWTGPPSAGTAGKAAFSLVLVGDTAYCASRLGPSGRRVVHQDAGAALAQLYWCCRAVGWRMAVQAEEGRDTIMAALDLDGRREAITAVIDVAVPPRPLALPASVTSPRGAMRRASSILRRSGMTYSFDSTPLSAAPVEEAVRRSLSLTRDIWPPAGGAGPQVGCVLYARRVSGLPPGCYDPIVQRALTGSEPGALNAVMESYLGDRHLDPPALVLFLGDREATLSAYGAAGHTTLISKCAAAASLTRLLGTAGGLSSGLFARLPSALLDAAAGRLRAGPQVYCGLAIGRGSGSPPGMDVMW